jgi:hypothetical protein
MIYHPIKQDIDLWEAWIEFDQESPHYFGTLYLIGEVAAAKKDPHPFVIKSVSDTNKQQLILTVQTTTSAHPSRMAEVVYSEPLTHIDQYSSILIYQDNELIAQIKDIEVLV